MSDLSNFDIVKCGNKGCNFWHIILTMGYNTKEEALIEINRLIQDSNEVTSCAFCGGLSIHEDSCKIKNECNYNLEQLQAIPKIHKVKGITKETRSNQN